MSSEKEDISYKRGVTGFVELHKDVAKKYAEFDQLYWLKEYSILLYLWAYRTDNIIKYRGGAIVYKKDIKTDTYKTYSESILDRYPATLHDRRLYRDREIIQFLLDITSALTCLHSKNIIHRDVKPPNILLTDDNRAVLVDFSHSHKMDIPLEQLDSNVVTYWYRAPEIFKYQEKKEVVYDASIDMWALGTVMIELLTGTNFAAYYTSLLKNDKIAEELYGTMLQNQKDAFKRMKDYYFAKKRNFVHADQYWAWISKMIAPEPERRITAAELYEEVKKFADTRSIKYVTPVNGSVEVIMPVLENKPTSDNPELLNQCVEYLKTIRIENRMIFDIRRIIEVVKFLIQQKEITAANYQSNCAAIAIILETVLFDNMIHFDDYGVLNNWVVKDAIIELVRKYDQYLFGIHKIFSYSAD